MCGIIVGHRIPAMQTLRLERSWRGHYARSRLDYSPILGRCEGNLENLVLANGFSGHGLQQSPAMGRGTSELITYGEFRTLDLTPFGYARVVENRPLVEMAVI